MWFECRLCWLYCGLLGSVFFLLECVCLRSLCSPLVAFVGCTCFHGLEASHRAPWTAKIQKNTAFPRGYLLDAGKGPKY